jgi:hypothetical protein
MMLLKFQTKQPGQNALVLSLITNRQAILMRALLLPLYFQEAHEPSFIYFVVLLIGS